jgi:hypothetical protein
MAWCQLLIFTYEIPSRILAASYCKASFSHHAVRGSQGCGQLGSYGHMQDRSGLLVFGEYSFPYFARNILPVGRQDRRNGKQNISHSFDARC